MSTQILKVKLIFFNICLQYPAEQTRRATPSTGMKITIFLYMKMLLTVRSGDNDVAAIAKHKGHQSLSLLLQLLRKKHSEYFLHYGFV
jgi:hypothetical protein